jgi:NTF2 fold immunity protein
MEPGARLNFFEADSLEEMKKNIQVLLIVILPLISCGQNSRIVPGEQGARQIVTNALNDSNYKPFYDTLIKDRRTAIAVVEPILFGIYGKKIIIRERPYKCYLVDGYWCISGTLRKNYDGGVFEIIISSKNGEVIKLIHGK